MNLLGAQREPKELRPRIFVVGGFFVLGLLVLAVNLYRLMVVRYEEFLALSVDNQFKDVRVRAPRGLIRDRRGEVLVDARPSLDVFITPAFCQRCVAEVIPRLESLLGWTPDVTARVIDQVKGTRGPQRATMKLDVEGKQMIEECEGNGPVDAVFNCVKAMVPHEAVLELYQVHAVTEGTDAQAEVSVRLSENGRSVTSKGADPDTLVASAKAYLGALNKLII